MILRCLRLLAFCVAFLGTHLIVHGAHSHTHFVANCSKTSVRDQLRALQLFYVVTQGDYWFQRDGWYGNLSLVTLPLQLDSVRPTFSSSCLSRPASNVLPDHCCWFGIQCTQDGYVHEIELPSNNIDPIINADPNIQIPNGTEPLPTLTNYLGCSLTSLNLNSNKLLGAFLGPLLQGLTNLMSLSLADNLLTGSLPESLGRLVNNNLQFLNLNHNLLTGNLSQGQLCNPSGDSPLASLSLVGNNLQGDPLIEYCADLFSLDLSYNNMSCTTFPHIARPNHMSVINLAHNSFLEPLVYNSPDPALSGYGQLDAIMNWTHITAISAASSNIFGTIPADIGRLQSLVNVDLAYNSIPGTIPESLFRIGSLQSLFLNWNWITGTIPSLDKAKSLLTLDLSYLSLTGTIPSGIVQILKKKGSKVDLRLNFLTCCATSVLIKNVDGASNEAADYSNASYASYNYSMPRLPPGLQLSKSLRPVLNRANEVGVYSASATFWNLGNTSYSGLSCPYFILKGAEDTETNFLELYLDPDYSLYEGCKCPIEANAVWVNRNGLRVLTCVTPKPVNLSNPSVQPWYVSQPWIIAVIAALGFFVILALVLLLWFIRFHGLGQKNSNDLTLVVTDIQNSTILWEALDSEVMTKTLRLHHSIVRELLSTFRGKEEATEGDSFLLSFREPRHALSFSLALHERLLTAKYEEELLRHPDGAPVWVKVSKSFATRCHHGWLGDFQLSSAPGADQVPIEIQTSIVNTMDFTGILHHPSTTGLAHLQEHLTIADGEALAPNGSLDLGRTTSLKLTNKDLYKLAGGGSDIVARPEGSTRGAPPLRSTVLAFRGLRVRVGIHTISRDHLSSVLPPSDALERLKSIPTSPGSRIQTLISRPLSQDLYAAANSTRNASVSINIDPVAGEALPQPSQSTFGLQRLRSTPSRRSSFISLTSIARMAHAHDWHIAKAVCDSGHGGMTMISKSCFDKLDLSRGRAFAPPPSTPHPSTPHPATKPPASKPSVSGPDTQSKSKVDQPSSPLIPLPPALFLRLGAHCLKQAPSQQDQASLELYTSLSPHLFQQIPFYSSSLPNQWSQKTGSLQLRTRQRLELDALEAPLARVSIAFAQLVGVATLMAWDEALTRQALDVFAAHAQQLALERNGYIVEMTSSGLCLASFSSPLDAVCWAKSLSHALKLADWNAALLQHELCEAIQANQFLPFRKKDIVGGERDEEREFELPSKYAKGSRKQKNKAPVAIQDAQASNYLLRGPRLKIGIDMGHTSSEISPCTGRLIYRGRVMNRASRISSMAPSGLCWCSLNAWQEAERQAGSSDALLYDYEVQGWEVGSVELKGIAGQMSVVQFIHRGSIGSSDSNSQALATCMHLAGQQSTSPPAVGMTLQPASLDM